MKLLVFEYSCICLEDNLMSEGLNMLQCILEDLEFNSSFDIDYLINEKISTRSYHNPKPIYLNDNLFEWLNKNSKKYDYALFIAPENDLIQYNITKILEKNNVIILGCNSSSSYICSSKQLTYDKMPDDILKIKSMKFNTTNISYDNLSSSFKKPFIVKPDGKTSSEMVYLIKNKDEFEEKMDIYKNECVQDILIQEYIEGESLSVSLVTDGTHIECISLNSQQILMKDFEIKFVGCISPIEHHLKDEIFKISENIIRSIPGLKGFVGIDFIIKEDDIFFIEVNSRITTPYIILKNMCNQNLTESIINLLVYGKRTKLTFKDVGEFIL